MRSYTRIRAYYPPMMRRRGFPGSPGQILIVLVLVLAVLIMYRGSADPSGLARAARDLAFLLPALILSLSVHELAHAWVAYRLGDTTARSQGRLTLDPRAPLDPPGTLMPILTVITRFGIGSARPGQGN